MEIVTLRQQLKELCERDAQTMQGFFQLEQSGMWPKIIDLVRADVYSMEIRIEELEQTSDPGTKQLLDDITTLHEAAEKKITELESVNANLENDKEILLAKLNYDNKPT